MTTPHAPAPALRRPMPLAGASVVLDAFRLEAQQRREYAEIHNATCFARWRNLACSTCTETRRMAEDAAIRLCRAENREREGRGS